MSVRKHRRGKSRDQAKTREELALQTSVSPRRGRALPRILAAIMMGILALPLLFWLSWPLGFIFKANPIMLSGLVALAVSAIMSVLWERRAISARHVFRRALLTVAIVALMLPLNGLPFLISEIRLASGGGTAPNPLGSRTAVAMAAVMTFEDAVAGVILAAVALALRWAIRFKERDR